MQQHLVLVLVLQRLLSVTHNKETMLEMKLRVFHKLMKPLQVKVKQQATVITLTKSIWFWCAEHTKSHLFIYLFPKTGSV